jgi:hypothetical protein
MLTTGNDVFIQLPHETQKRILHPGLVQALTEGGYQAQFAEADLNVQEGQDLLVYYTLGQEFVKQSARIESVASEPADSAEGVSQDSDLYGPVLLLSVSGEPVSAESRQCFRVSTVIGDHAVELAGEPCKLLDVSFTGFAVQTHATYEIGQVIEAGVDVNGESYTGNVCVQSLSELRPGLVRYGLYCSDEHDAEGGLKTGLQKLSMAIQREQLNRLAGV